MTIPNAYNVSNPEAGIYILELLNYYYEATIEYLDVGKYEPGNEIKQIHVIKLDQFGKDTTNIQTFTLTYGNQDSQEEMIVQPSAKRHSKRKINWKTIAVTSLLKKKKANKQSPSPRKHVVVPAKLLTLLLTQKYRIEESVTWHYSRKTICARLYLKSRDNNRTNYDINNIDIGIRMQDQSENECSYGELSIDRYVISPRKLKKFIESSDIVELKKHLLYMLQNN